MKRFEEKLVSFLGQEVRRTDGGRQGSSQLFGCVRGEQQQKAGTAAAARKDDETRLTLDDDE